MHWNEFFDNNKILNRGIGGDITTGVLARMDEVIRHQPSKLFICIGTNDLARGIEVSNILENYNSIIDAIEKESPQTKIYVQSVLPVGKKLVFGHQNIKIEPLNMEIEKMCAERNIIYINLYPDFLDEKGFLKSKYTNDNLHLLGEGYLLWMKKIEKYIVE